MGEFNLVALGQILRDAARSEAMPRFRDHQRSPLRSKESSIDFVTEADIATQAHIERRVRELWPKVEIVAEENSANAGEAGKRLAQTDMAIVIDPLDGTGNFVAGLPLFVTIAAVVVSGQTQAALIYDPVLDELAWAERGQGAWMLSCVSGLARELRVERASGLSTMRGTASLGGLSEDERTQTLARLGKVGLLSAYRCAGHELRALASGKLHFTIYTELRPWDHAAGVLIVEEAGGFAALADGSIYSPVATAGSLLVAPDRCSWDTLNTAVLSSAAAGQTPTR